MADSGGIADTLAVELQLMLANAREEWHSFKKDVEGSPLKATVDMQRGGTDARTLSGAPAVHGPANDRVADPVRSPMSGLGASIDNALITRGSIGGSGFGPAVGPLPTAAVNSVYGGISSGVALSAVEAAAIGRPMRTSSSAAAVAHTDREYGAYRVRAVRSGIMDPMDRATFDQQGGFQRAMFEIDSWNEQRARNRSDAAMNRQMLRSQPFHGPGYNPDGSRGRVPGGGGQSTVEPTGPGMFPNIRNAFTAYAGIQMAGGAFAAQNQLAYARIGAMGDRLGYAQATIDNNPMAAFVSSIPLGIGSGIVSAADYISQGRIDAARTLQQVRLQEGVTGALRDAGDARRMSGLSLQYAGAMAAGGFSAQMAGFAMQSAMVEPNRQLRAASLKAPLMAEVEGLTQAREQLRAALPRKIVKDTSAWAGDEVDVSSLPTKNGGQIDLSGLPFTPDAGVKAKFDAYNEAVAKLNDARGRMNSVDESTRQIAAQEVKTIETQMRLAKRFDTIEGARINQETNFGLAASLAGARGDTVGSMGASIAAQFSPRIAAVQAQIDATKAEGGEISFAQQMEIRALTVGREVAARQAFTGFARSSVTEFGGLRAGALGLAYKPFDAMRAQAEAAFTARITSIDYRGESVTADPTSDVYRRASSERDLRMAQITQNENYQRRALDTSLAAQDASLNYRFGRNQIGGQAAELVGSTINQIRDMTRAQFYEQGEKLRSNTLSELDLMAKEYGLSFRAESFAAQTMLINNPRDTQSPEAVFGSIEAEKAKLDAAQPSPDKDTATGGKISADVQWLEENLAETIKKAVEELLAK